MKLNHRYTVTLNEKVTQEGIDKIRRFLWTAKGEWSDQVPYLSLPDTFDFTWKTEDGKLPKRIARYYYQTYNIKLTPDVLSEIGNIARDHSQDGETYTFEFVDEFNWQAGDFGDWGSCFFGGRRSALVTLRENGAWAICFYDENGKGKARAWLFDRDTYLIVFNGYGFTNSSTLRIAKILAAFKGQSYKYVMLRGGGIVYINNAAGYIVGELTEISPRSDISFYLDEYYCCYECDDTLDEDSVYYGPDDHHYCDNCFYQRWDSCEHCGEVYDRDDIHEVNGHYLCEWCRDDRFEHCETHDTYYRGNQCPHCPVPKPIAKK